VVILAAFACLIPVCSFADTIKLKSGEEFRGKIVSETEKQLSLQLPDLSIRNFQKSDIAMISREDKDTGGDPAKPVAPWEKPRNGKRSAESEADAETRFAELMAKAIQGSITPEELEAGLIETGPLVVDEIFDYLGRNPAEKVINPLLGAALKLKNKNTCSRMTTLLSSRSGALRLAVVQALWDLGDADAVVALLVPLASGNRDLKNTARKALTSILMKEADNPAPYQALHSAISSLEPGIKIEVASILGSTNSIYAVPILLELIREWEKPRVRIAAVTALGRLGISRESVCKPLRELLENKEPHMRREAALALGRLEDIESVAKLIELLEDEHGGVRGNAHWALKRISGLRFPLKHTRWELWRTDEFEANKTERAAYLQQLKSGTREEKIEAINKLVVIRLGRLGIASALLDFIDFGAPTVREAVCKALGALKVKQAVPKLISRLEDTHGPAAQAAHEALKRITGRELPRRKDAWQKAIAAEGG
jgi:HEAT repeat protein